MKLTIKHPPPRVHRSVGTSLIADAFGIGRRLAPRLIAEGLELPIAAGQRVTITGPSGSGKSSLLRAIAESLTADGRRLAWPGEQPLPRLPVIDCVELPLGESMRLLAACGLAEPRLLLLTPEELSEGERLRFRLARALAREPDWVLIDEFAAALDSTLAKVLAFNLRRQSLRQGCGVILASCHEASIGDFAPELRIACDLDGRIEVQNLDHDGKEKQTWSHWPTTSKSPPVPEPTGRTSLGGITAPGSWGRSAS